MSAIIGVFLGIGEGIGGNGRLIIGSMLDGESEKAADYFAENGAWTTPFGIFTGKVKSFLDW